jgi:hypothetical protein
VVIINVPHKIFRTAQSFLHRRVGMVPETGIEPVRPLSGKRRILSPLCLPISPLGHCVSANIWHK